MPWTSAFSSQPVRQVARLMAVVEDSHRLAERAVEVEDWSSVIDAAFEHGVGGLLMPALRRAGCGLPPPVALEADDVMAKDRLWSRKLLKDLATIQEVFEQAAVRAVALKGPVLGERVYPEGSPRPCGDLDFLVTEEAFAAAADALKSLGYAEEALRPGRRHLSHASAFDAPGRVRVELHWQASSKFATTLAAEPLLERSVIYRLEGGHEVRILESADELLYLSVHASRHRFDRLRWIWEVGALMRQCSEEDSRRLVERARGAGVSRAVALTLSVLHARLECDRAVHPLAELSVGLSGRAGLAIAGVANDPGYRERGFIRKSAFVISRHTYRALLSDRPAAAAMEWGRSMGRSAVNLVRRGPTTEGRRGASDASRRP